MRPEPVPFIDLAAQRQRLGTAIDEAVSRVLNHCQFINGPEVTRSKRSLPLCGAKHVVSCASGTDALLMVLMAKTRPRRCRVMPVLHFLRDRRGGGADRRNAGVRRCR